MGYRSIQFSPDGEAYIFDYHGETIQDVWNQVNDQGSKWYFYPVPFVVKDMPWQDFSKSKVIDTPIGFEFLRGKTIRTAMNFIKDNQMYVLSYCS